MKLRLLTVTAPVLLFSFIVKPKTNAVAPFVLVSVADQFPLTGVPEPLPHPLNPSATMHKIKKLKYFIRSSAAEPGAIYYPEKNGVTRKLFIRRMAKSAASPRILSMNPGHALCYVRFRVEAWRGSNLKLAMQKVQRTPSREPSENWELPTETWIPNSLDRGQPLVNSQICAIVNDPDPVHPSPVPVSAQVPLIALPLTVPCNTTWLVPLVNELPDSIVSENELAGMPFDAFAWYVLLAVVPDPKQSVDVVKVRLLTLMEVVLPCVSSALNVRIVVPFELKVADQFPVTLPELLLLLPPPQAVSIMASPHNTHKHTCLIPSSEKTLLDC